MCWPPGRSVRCRACSRDEIDDRADDRGGLSVAEPAHAGRKIARLDAVLDQAGDHDAGIGQQRIEVGAAARAVREHLAGSAVRIEPDRHHEARAAVLELDRLGGSGDREDAVRVIARLPASRSPTAGWRGVGLVVVGGAEAARADGGDHRLPCRRCPCRR